MIQVSHRLDNLNTREREIRTIEDASKELPVENALILTDVNEKEVMVSNVPVRMQSITEWLAEQGNS